MIPDEDQAPRAGEIGLTWIQGWTGVWVSLGQWLAGDGGKWPWGRHAKKLPMGRPTHAFLVLEDSVIIEGQPGGAAVGMTVQYRDRPVMYSKLPLTDEQRAKISEIALTYEGTPYNWFDYLYLALWRVRVRPKWLQRRIQNTGRMICSQLCDKALEEVGFNLFTDGRLNQDVTPGDLYRLLAAKGWW